MIPQRAIDAILDAAAEIRREAAMTGPVCVCGATTRSPYHYPNCPRFAEVKQVATGPHKFGRGLHSNDCVHCDYPATHPIHIMPEERTKMPVDEPDEPNHDYDAELTVLARRVFFLYRRLLAEGFSQEQAFSLAGDWMRTFVL